MTAALIELPPPPRRLRRRVGVGIGPLVGRWLIRVFIFPHCVIGICLILATLYLPALVLFGDNVPGKVTSLNTSRGKSGFIYHLHYSFDVDGMTYHDSETVRDYEYASTKVGQPISVRVLTAFPNILPQRQTGRSPWLSVGKFLLMALFWNGILSLFVWLAWIAPLRTRRLLKYGVAVAGQIIQKRRIPGNKGGASYQVRYVFVPSVDEQANDTFVQLVNAQMTISVKDFGAAEEGQVVTVFFDPKKPHRSLIYNFAECEAVE